jgi:hypothetical protein
MILIDNLKIGFPILFFGDVQVQYTAPCIPTAFEKILIKICNKFSKDDGYGGVPVKRLFNDILGVPDCDVMLKQTIDELNAINAIRCFKNTDELEMILLRDLTLTERGQRLQKDGILQGVAWTRQMEFYFDPITKELQTKLFGTGTKPKYAVDETYFMEQFPDQQIREYLEQIKQNGNDSQLTKNAVIDSVTSNNNLAVRWNCVFADIELQKGQLNFFVRNAEYGTYINSMAAETVFEMFLAKTFSLRSMTSLNMEIATLPSEEFEKLQESEWKPAGQVQNLPQANLRKVPVRFSHTELELIIALNNTEK